MRKEAPPTQIATSISDLVDSGSDERHWSGAMDATLD